MGDLGERWTIGLLKSARFKSVRDLNAIRYNHPGGDFLAQRDGNLYFITTKARNKFVQGSRRLNGGYNIYPERVRAAAREYDAIPAWLTIQLDTDRRCLTAYFGTIDSLRNPNAVAVPMSPGAVSNYECLAKDRFDPAIISGLSNQFVARPAMSTRDSPSASRYRTANAAARSSSSKRLQAAVGATRGRGAGAVQFEDHVAYTESALRPVLRELRRRILALGRMEENVTLAQRITYSVARIFAEVKVQKKRILVRVFDMGYRTRRELSPTSQVRTNGSIRNKSPSIGWSSSIMGCPLLRSRTAHL